MSFVYRQEFTEETQVAIHHKFGVAPDQVAVYDTQAQKIQTASIVHGATKTTITFAAPETGTATVSVSEKRVGTTRFSPDGTEWALFVTNYGTVQAIKVPTVNEDDPTPAVELGARIAARIEELRVAIVSMSERRYMPHNRDKLMHLALDAKIDGLVNRQAYCEDATNWLTSLYAYYASKATEMSQATSFAALDAITWDINPYDQLYDAATAPLGDPEASILTAMGIPN